MSSPALGSVPVWLFCPTLYFLHSIILQAPPSGGPNRTMNAHSICCAASGFLGGRGSDSGGWEGQDVEGKGLAPTRGPPGELRLMEQMGRPQASLS